VLVSVTVLLASATIVLASVTILLARATVVLASDTILLVSVTILKSALSFFCKQVSLDPDDSTFHVYMSSKCSREVRDQKNCTVLCVHQHLCEKLLSCTHW
jgi:hypothetical protein